MDANGSRFHLLLGRDDWAECTVDGTKLRNIWQASPPQTGGGKLSWRDERQELTSGAPPQIRGGARDTFLRSATGAAPTAIATEIFIDRRI